MSHAIINYPSDTNRMTRLVRPAGDLNGSGAALNASIQALTDAIAAAQAVLATLNTVATDPNLSSDGSGNLACNNITCDNSVTVNGPSTASPKLILHDTTSNISWSWSMGSDGDLYCAQAGVNNWIQIVDGTGAVNFLLGGFPLTIQSQAAPIPSIGFNAVHTGGGWNFGPSSSGNYASMMQSDAGNGGLSWLVSDSVGNAGDPINFIYGIYVTNVGHVLVGPSASDDGVSDLVVGGGASFAGGAATIDSSGNLTGTNASYPGGSSLGITSNLTVVNNAFQIVSGAGPYISVAGINGDGSASFGAGGLTIDANGGVKLPDYTTISSPVEGQIAWNYTTHALTTYNGSAWT